MELDAALWSLQRTLDTRPRELEVLLAQPTHAPAVDQARSVRSILDEIELETRLMPTMHDDDVGTRIWRSDLEPEPEPLAFQLQRVTDEGGVMAAHALASRPDPKPAAVEEELHEWLHQLRLTRYAGAIAQLGAVLLEHMCHMTVEDVQSLGMKPLEERRFVAALRDIQAESEAEAGHVWETGPQLMVASSAGLPVDQLPAAVEVAMPAMDALQLTIDYDGTIATIGGASRPAGLREGNRIVRVDKRVCRNGHEVVAALEESAKRIDAADVAIVMLCDAVVLRQDALRSSPTVRNPQQHQLMPGVVGQSQAGRGVETAARSPDETRVTDVSSTAPDTETELRANQAPALAAAHTLSDRAAESADYQARAMSQEGGPSLPHDEPPAGTAAPRLTTLAATKASGVAWKRSSQTTAIEPLDEEEHGDLPAPPPPASDDDEVDTAAENLTKATALDDYNSEEPGDLHFNAGDIIIVTSQPDDWWTGYREADASTSGEFPRTYVELLE